MKNLLKILCVSILVVIAYSITNCFANQTPTNTQVTSVKASHILVNTKEEADSIKSRIDKGECFETLAKQYSKCPSGESGGDLGYFERGQMVKPFEDAAFSLPTGQVSQPIKTQFGWHIIKVYDKK